MICVPIQKQRQGLADANIVEGRLARIEGEPLDTLRVVVEYLALLNQSPLDVVEVHLLRPLPRPNAGLTTKCPIRPS